MKATDLTIDDWVIYRERLCTILAIDAQSDTLTLQIRKGDDMGVYLYDVPIADVEPVPLTEEILDSNGARREDDYRLDEFKFFIGGFVLVKFPKHWNIFLLGYFSKLKSIKYVHELQHCLAFVDEKQQLQTF